MDGKLDNIHVYLYCNFELVMLLANLGMSDMDGMVPAISIGTADDLWAPWSQLGRENRPEIFQSFEQNCVNSTRPHGRGRQRGDFLSKKS